MRIFKVLDLRNFQCLKPGINQNMYFRKLVCMLPLLVGIVSSNDVNWKDCKQGFYFDTIQCQPCSGNCTSCLSASSCNSCKDGFYGETCSMPCLSNCYRNMCNKTTGLCLYCGEGYFMDKTHSCISCPEHCNRCVSTSDCLECIDGYKGIACNEECSNCAPGTACSQDNGYCLSECKDGLTGTKCDQSCDIKCATCSRDNQQRCIKCQFNRYGMYCNNNCSKSCLDNTCDDTNGYCTNGCRPGHWGNMCEHSCSDQCIDKQCNRTNGQCTNGCANNYTGSNCLCPKNCNCDDDGMCKSCKQGFGILCEFNCSDGCVNKECHKESGECVHGCLKGFVGKKCIKGLQGASIRRKSESNAANRVPVAIGVIFWFVLVLVCSCGMDCSRKIKAFYKDMIMKKTIESNTKKNRIPRRVINRLRRRTV